MDVVKETRELLSERRIASVIVEFEEELPPGVPPRMALVVSQDDLEKALSVLGDKFKDMLDQEGVSKQEAIEYTSCPACGSKITDTLEECPECGLVVGQA